jgi:hypothetical protein
LAARLAERAGRVGADGFATLALPVNERTAGDTRANAITAVDVKVEPAAAATDLRPIRAALKQVLIRRQEVPDERWALLPLTPLLPQWLVRRMAGVALGGATTSGSSNLGALNPAANRPDGTDADHFAMKTLYPGVTKATTPCRWPAGVARDGADRLYLNLGISRAVQHHYDCGGTCPGPGDFAHRHHGLGCRRPMGAPPDKPGGG